jgi:hypothetical protein
MAKSADAAKLEAEKRAAKNKALALSAKGKLQTPTAEAARRSPNKETVRIRTNPGISGKGGSMVGGLYKPMGSGGINQYNK